MFGRLVAERVGSERMSEREPGPDVLTALWLDC